MVNLLNDYLRKTFGCKVYKLALNGGFSCPNRDGTLDTRGCIFCSEGGSGEFTPDPSMSITDQIENAKGRVAEKIKDGKYIAYFQAFTGTYAPAERLKSIYMEAIEYPDIVWRTRYYWVGYFVERGFSVKLHKNDNRVDFIRISWE